MTSNNSNREKKKIKVTKLALKFGAGLTRPGRNGRSGHRQKAEKRLMRFGIPYHEAQSMVDDAFDATLRAVSGWDVESRKGLRLNPTFVESQKYFHAKVRYVLLGRARTKARLTCMEYADREIDQETPGNELNTIMDILDSMLTVDLKRRDFALIASFIEACYICGKSEREKYAEASKTYNRMMPNSPITAGQFKSRWLRLRIKLKRALRRDV